MTMTDKVTPKSMENQYDHQYNVFCRKNHDYGNSFEKSLDTFGLVAGIVRMNDKFERLVSLNDPSKDAQIASESLVDTLEDLSNYAAMAACWLKGKKAADWKELRLKELDGNIESIIKNADAIVDNMKGEYRPQFSGIHLNGPEKLELDLNIPHDKWDEVMAYVHRPDTLPKNPPVKVNYGHNAVYEFPDGIDAISYYVREMQKEEAKKENDRVMLDMMLSRIEKGEVVRIVANGDGSFTTYFEKTDGPFDKIVDKEDESIFYEREGWEEEEKEKNLNDIRKEHGFDPVNGEKYEG